MIVPSRTSRRVDQTSASCRVSVSDIDANVIATVSGSVWSIILFILYIKYNKKLRCVKHTKTTIMVWPTIQLHDCQIHYYMAVRHPWVAYRRHVKVLEQFQQRILRAILGVHWHDRITNARILEQADTTSIEAHIVRSQLSWAGHVRRMPDTRVPKQLLYAELSSGKRKTGGQWKRYKDQLKANLKKCEMDLQWETTADGRAYWRRTSRMGVANLERRWIITEAEKRERRKNLEYDNDTAAWCRHVCHYTQQ